MASREPSVHPAAARAERPVARKPRIAPLAATGPRSRRPRRLMGDLPVGPFRTSSSGHTRAWSTLRLPSLLTFKSKLNRPPKLMPPLLFSQTRPQYSHAEPHRDLGDDHGYHQGRDLPGADAHYRLQLHRWASSRAQARKSPCIKHLTLRLAPLRSRPQISPTLGSITASTSIASSQVRSAQTGRASTFVPMPCTGPPIAPVPNIKLHNPPRYSTSDFMDQFGCPYSKDPKSGRAGTGGPPDGTYKNLKTGATETRSK
eukprot:scaffold13240_cov90-Isochrysis_galbana.AAC.2